MAIRQCKSCALDTLEWKNEMYCFHQREVLFNPYYWYIESLREGNKERVMFFTELQDFTLPNIL